MQLEAVALMNGFDIPTSSSFVAGRPIFIRRNSNSALALINQVTVVETGTIKGSRDTGIHGNKLPGTAVRRRRTTALCRFMYSRLSLMMIMVPLPCKGTSPLERKC